MALCTRRLPWGTCGSTTLWLHLQKCFSASLKSFQQQSQSWHSSDRRENKNPKRRSGPDGLERIINLMEPSWLVDWKPLPTFLEKRDLLEIKQWGGEGRCQGQQSTEDPRARAALGLPRRGTSVTGGSFVKQDKLWGLQWCERNIHQNPRCAQQLAAHSDGGRRILHSVLVGPRQGPWSGLGSVPRVGWVV